MTSQQANIFVLLAIIVAMLLLFANDNIAVGGTRSPRRSRNRRLQRSRSGSRRSRPISRVADRDSALLFERHPSAASAFWFFFIALSSLLLIYLLVPPRTAGGSTGLAASWEMFHPVIHGAVTVLSNFANFCLLMAALCYSSGKAYGIWKQRSRIAAFVAGIFVWTICWEVAGHRQSVTLTSLMLAPDVVMANVAFVLLGWSFYVRWKGLGTIYFLFTIIYALLQLPALISRELGDFFDPRYAATTDKLFFWLAGGKALLAYGFLSLLSSSVCPAIRVDEKKNWPADFERPWHAIFPRFKEARFADFIIAGVFAIVFAIIVAPFAEPIWTWIRGWMLPAGR